MVTTDLFGRVVRVFNPGWRVWRWIPWFFSKDGVETNVSWTVPIQGSKLWRSNGQLVVAAYLVPREQVSPRAAIFLAHEKPTRPTD